MTKTAAFLFCCSFFLLGASYSSYWYDVGDPMANTKIRLTLPTRINNMPIEFSNSDSIMEGDSGSIWIATRDGNQSGTQRKGLQVDHDGHTGLGVFDAANNWKLWASERPDGPNSGDTLKGMVIFFATPIRDDVDWEFDNGTVTVTHTNHGYLTDDEVSITESGSGEVDTPKSTITKIDNDTYTYEFSGSPSSSGTAKAARIGDAPQFGAAYEDDAGNEWRYIFGTMSEA